MDFHAQSRAPLLLRDSNPGAAHVSAGGVTRNILENLARLGESVSLITAFGNDFQGEYIRRNCCESGIDISDSLLCPGESSSCYLALLDHDGDMFAALSDMHILERITPSYLETKKNALAAADAVVCDPCVMPDALEWITSGALGDVPVFADPVSTTYARRLAPFAGKLFCLKPNRMELEAMTGIGCEEKKGLELAADKLLCDGCGCVAVSLGAEGCYWADREGNRFFRSLRPVPHVTDATGAGDAFMAGLIYSFVHDLNAERGTEIALAAGIAAVTSAGTVSRGLCPALLEHILEENR